MTGNDSVVLRVAGRPVGRYVTRPELRARLSPRPYLHPVTTLAGTAVTELSPADHTHHLGVGVAVPDVEGFNFWGGRTYVQGRGPTELDNHGTQRHAAYQLRDPDGFVEELRWVAAPGELLRERRTVAATALTDTAWALDFTFSLTNVTGAPLSLGSPATNGRPGAAYGASSGGPARRRRHRTSSPPPPGARARSTAGPPTGSPSPAPPGPSSSPGPPNGPAGTPGSYAPPNTRASAPPRPYGPAARPARRDRGPPDRHRRRRRPPRPHRGRRPGPQGGEPVTAARTGTTYRNPVLNADWSDPDVIRVGDDFYLTASSFGRAPDCPCCTPATLSTGPSSATPSNASNPKPSSPPPARLRRLGTRPAPSRRPLLDLLGRPRPGRLPGQRPRDPRPLEQPAAGQGR
ncbi:hypothetical protein SHKM778_68480 [Streptomyces sp. KM77-8]|uniref:Oxidoreductase n=1 Tax=Streptomyces haneummycinicus TaxID=3074435 RepID=A0AAT9HTY2_9ACTN